GQPRGPAARPQDGGAAAGGERLRLAGAAAGGARGGPRGRQAAGEAGGGDRGRARLLQRRARGSGAGRAGRARRAGLTPRRTAPYRAGVTDEGQRVQAPPPPLAFLVRGPDRPGLLHALTGVISAHHGNITSVEILERGEHSTIFFEIDPVADG